MSPGDYTLSTIFWKIGRNNAKQKYNTIIVLWYYIEYFEKNIFCRPMKIPYKMLCTRAWQLIGRKCALYLHWHDLILFICGNQRWGWNLWLHLSCKYIYIHCAMDKTNIVSSFLFIFNSYIIIFNQYSRMWKLKKL
jgi:hypothetical protein